MGIDEIYNIMLIVGTLSGTSYFILRLIFRCKSAKRTAIVAAVMLVSVLISLVGGLLVRRATYPTQYIANGDLIPNEYYVAFVFFFLCASIAFPILKDETYLRTLATDSLLIFSFISRIGCLVAGCCGGKEIGGIIIPIPILEMVFAAALFILFRFLTTKNNLTLYALLYSIFRFTTEFLRAPDGMSVFGGLNVRQYLAIVVVIYILTEYILKEVMKNDKKTAS